MRAFIAIPLPASAKEEIVSLQAELRRCGLSLRWVQPENMHLTLVFLGEISEAVVPDLSEGLDKIASAHTVLDMSLEGVGMFPNERAPRVHWVGVVKGSEAIRVIEKEIEQLALTLGIAVEEGKFHPHITIGRCKDKPQRSNLPEKLRLARLSDVQVDSVHLIKSELGGGRPVYTDLHRAALHTT